MNALIRLNRGVVEDVQLVKHSGTAEAVYDDMAKELLGELYDELLEEYKTYEVVYEKVNQELEKSGREIVWYEDLTVNNFK